MKRKFNKEHKAWRKAILERDNNKCVLCDKGTYLNAHHLIPNTFKDFEWDIHNGLTLCATHHTLGKYSAHKNPIWFTLWLKEQRPNLYNLAKMRIEHLTNPNRNDIV